MGICPGRGFEEGGGGWSAIARWAGGFGLHGLQCGSTTTTSTSGAGTQTTATKSRTVAHQCKTPPICYLKSSLHLILNAFKLKLNQSSGITLFKNQYLFDALFIPTLLRLSLFTANLVCLDVLIMLKFTVPVPLLQSQHVQTINLSY